MNTTINQRVPGSIALAAVLAMIAIPASCANPSKSGSTSTTGSTGVATTATSEVAPSSSTATSTTSEGSTTTTTRTIEVATTAAPSTTTSAPASTSTSDEPTTTAVDPVTTSSSSSTSTSTEPLTTTTTTAYTSTQLSQVLLGTADLAGAVEVSDVSATYPCTPDPVFGDVPVVTRLAGVRLPSGAVVYSRLGVRADDTRDWSAQRLGSSKGCTFEHPNGIHEKVELLDHIDNGPHAPDQWFVGWTGQRAGSLPFGGGDQYIQIGRVVALVGCAVRSDAPLEATQACKDATTTFVSKLIGLVKR